MRTNRLILALGIASLCHVVAAGTDPIDQTQLDYNLKTTVEAYDHVGQRNPVWDAGARQSLTLFSKIRSWTSGTPASLISELKTNLSALDGLGCDDPLVRYLYGRFIYLDSHSAAEGATVMGGVATGLEKSGYPDIRKYYGEMWYRKRLLVADPQGTEARTLLQKAAIYLGKALDDGSMGEREAEQACDTLMTSPWWPEPDRWICYGILESSLTNKWKDSSFFYLSKGQAYLTWGWEARGRGYADTVSDAGWKLMAERLDIAANSLETAWKMNSNDVQICVEMMRVELGQGKGRERLETWFQRGMALDPGNHDVCDQKLEYLRPRWYGNIQQMIDFGKECTTNSNWKGTVRLMLADAHYKASQEFQDDNERKAYWTRPEVWNDIRFTFEQFFKLYPNEVGYRHNYAYDAARCGQWQEFENQIKLFHSTNYSYFGGKAKFDAMVRTAEQNLKKP